MNILYLGPFEREDSLGHSSGMLLKNICDLNKYEVYAKSINSGYETEFESSIKHKKIDELKKFPEIVIQHSSVNCLAIAQNAKNYFVPIHNQNISISKQYHEKIKKLDHVIVFDDFEYDKFYEILKDPNRISKIRLFTEKSKQNIIDLKFYNNHYKYYFIGSYDSDKESIESIMYSFLAESRSLENTCLIICCESNLSEQKRLTEYYEKVKEHFKLKNREDKILFMLGPTSSKKELSLHKTADVFFALNKENYPVSNVTLAKSFGNIIIDYSDFSLDKTTISGMVKYDILNSSMKKILYDLKTNNFEKKEKPYKELREILC